MNLVADYTKENLIVFLVIIVITGIICMVIGKIKSLLTDNSVKEYNSALNKVRDLEEKRKKFLKLGAIILVAIILFMVCVDIITFINYNAKAYAVVDMSSYQTVSARPLARSIFDLSMGKIIILFVYILLFHIVWGIYEKHFIEKRILNDKNLSDSEKALLCKSFVTPTIAIIGSCLLFEAIPLIIWIISESNIMY